MTSARRYFLLLPAATDAELIGVPSGSSRGDILAAARFLIEGVSSNKSLDPGEASVIIEEIRQAAERLLAASSPSPFVPAGRISPAAPVPAPGRRDIEADRMMGMALLRRNPRRAGTAYGLMSGRARFRENAKTGPEGPGPEAILPSVPDAAPEESSRVPWALALLVFLFFGAVIAEIILARKQLRIAMAMQAARSAPKVIAVIPDAGPGLLPTGDLQSEASALPPESASEIPLSSGATAGPRRSTAPAESLPIPRLAREEPGPESRRADDSRWKREWRDRWQRAAEKAVEFAGREAQEPGTDPSDPLARPLRRILLVDRLFGIDESFRLAGSGDLSGAMALLERIPSSPLPDPPRPEAAPSAEGGRDAELVKALRTTAVSGGGREQFLREYRSTKTVPPGPEGARAIVQEAVGGSSREIKAIARNILTDWASGSRPILEAIDDRFQEFHADPAAAAFIEDVAGAGPLGNGGPTMSRAAIVDKILVKRGSRAAQIDDAVAGLAATLEQSARRLGFEGESTNPVLLLRAVVAASGGKSVVPEDLTGPQSPIQDFVLYGTLLGRNRAAILSERMPENTAAIEEVVSGATGERARAADALAQSVINMATLVKLDAIEMGIPLPAPERQPPAAESPAPGDRETAPDAGLAERWGARLAALNPAKPVDYFLLAEEVGDESRDAPGRALARRLYGLAGALDPDHLGSSAALALASLEGPAIRTEQALAGRWKAAARRWEGSRVSRNRFPAGRIADARPSLRLELAETLVLYRRGLGPKLIDMLKRTDLRELFDSLIMSLPGGEGFLARAEGFVKGTPPDLGQGEADALWRLERAVLDPGSGRWSDGIALGGNLPAVDPALGSPAEIFGEDPGKALWRDGRWVSSSLSNVSR